MEKELENLCREFSEKYAMNPDVYSYFVRAYALGQSSPNVITAYQLQARLVSDIAKHDAETIEMADRLWEIGERKASAHIGFSRNSSIKNYRDALGIIIDLIEVMESERAEVSR